MPEKQTAQTTLSDIVSVTYLNRENCTFTEKNGFLGLRATVDKKVSLWERHREEQQTDELVLGRIFFSRAFPFDKPFEYRDF